jgi:hypothetical protein
MLRLLFSCSLAGYVPAPVTAAAAAAEPEPAVLGDPRRSSAQGSTTAAPEVLAKAALATHAAAAVAMGVEGSEANRGACGVFSGATAARKSASQLSLWPVRGMRAGPVIPTQYGGGGGEKGCSAASHGPADSDAAA